MAGQMISGNRNIQEDSVSLNNWHYFDIEQDTVPGVSLNRAYKELIKNKKPQKVIVAVIDMKVAIHHEDLKSNIWENPGEIANNNSDDDSNGYIDDSNGWNFLGGFNTTENTIYTNYDETRIVKYYMDKYDNINDSTLIKDNSEFKLYQRASKKLERTITSAKSIIIRGDKIIADYKKGLEKVSPHLDEDDFTLARLDSLALIHPELTDHINNIKGSLRYNQKLIDLENLSRLYSNRVKYYVNLEYNDRKIIGDNSDDITDNRYGNNDFITALDTLYHGTFVAGIIAAEKENKLGIDGFGNHINIMPLSVSAFGDEHDKDMALAIRYAVDNGAKIINISSGKDFSLYQHWVNDAIKYAESKEVLIITSAGNSALNLDDPNNPNYPNDHYFLGQGEITDNFIKVGASTSSLDKIKNQRSNYGKNDVDIFAPGKDIYTTSSRTKEGYEWVSGTSFATPIVSGVAALVWSMYPSFTASEVKHILMDSGVEYDIMVSVPTKDNPDRMLPFNELSKSGKIVNVYNALLMAEQVVKAKKK